MSGDNNNLRLGVNIDHVATIRNARGGQHPDPVDAAKLAAKAGADGITAHLREDRRHISDCDIDRLTNDINLPLNLEMAATDEMLAIALHHNPHAACIVPEKRQEVTTEGGLDVAGAVDELAPYVSKLKAAGIRVSLFIDPDEAQLQAAHDIGAPVVELHTGQYCEVTGADQAFELERLKTAAKFGHSLGLEIHAGHGLTLENVSGVAKIPEIRELNIGHFLIGDAIFKGLEIAIDDMRALMVAARHSNGDKD